MLSGKLVYGIKNIDATLNRPEGERLIDAPFVFVDLQKYVEQLKHEDSWDKNTEWYHCL